jgi:3-oxoacyl-(acyl-carrier-protein) synthase
MKLSKRHSAPRRVVVTGMGAVAPNGVGVDAYCEALRNGASGVDIISLFETDGLECRVAAEVKNFAAEDFLSAQDMRRVVPALLRRPTAASERLQCVEFHSGQFVERNFAALRLSRPEPSHFHRLH